MGWMSSDDGYRRFNGRTYELERKSRSKKKLKRKAEEMKDSWIGGINSYRITREGTRYALWVR